MDIERPVVKTLDVQDRLEYARAAVAVLRALKILDRTMRHQDFARAIGLMPDAEKWYISYRNLIADILNLAAACSRQRRPHITLEIDRVVDESGKPGSGFWKRARIVREIRSCNDRPSRSTDHAATTSILPRTTSFKSRSNSGLLSRPLAPLMPSSENSSAMTHPCRRPIASVRAWRWLSTVCPFFVETRRYSPTRLVIHVIP